MHHMIYLLVEDLGCGLTINSTMAPVICAKLSITSVSRVNLTLYVTGLRYGGLYNVSFLICNFNVRYLHTKDIMKQHLTIRRCN